MATVWWWPLRRASHPEPADQVAKRLESIATELEDATTELRSIVRGLDAYSVPGREETK